MLQQLYKSKLARNTIWMTVGQGLRLVIQALYFVEIAHSLGARNYGAFISVVALVGIVFPFGSLGSGNLLVKNVVRNKNQFTSYWGRALAFTLCIGFLLLIGVCAIACLVLPPTIPLLLVALVAAADIFGLNIITISSQAFQAFEQLNWTAAINVMMSGGRLIGALILVALYPHPTALQWGFLYLGATAVVTLIAFFLACVKLGFPQLTLPRSLSEVREGFYFSTSQAAQTVYNDIDKTMLARLSTLEATGIYGAAYRIIDVSFVPVSALLWSSYPNFFRTGADGVAAAWKYAMPLLLRAFFYAAFICAALLASANLLPYFLGSEYAAAAEALRWLAVLPVLKVIHYFFSDTLTGSGHQGVRSSIQLCVALANVMVNFWLIPAYSWRGAAWSSIASDFALALAAGTAVFVMSRRSAVPIGDAITDPQPG
jgi:O-antigen/teichoic acid export membrane protein